MTESNAGLELIYAIGEFFRLSWKFFTDINVPGFNFSFAALLFALFLMGLGLRFLGAMFGMSAGSSVRDTLANLNTKPKNKIGF